MTIRPDLIFDIGVCNGDDSAYYLHKGFSVVGVEASPLLVPKLERRFAAEIRDGRYRLVTVGIAEREGEADFWICDDLPEWSSFDRSIASRNGSRHHAVKVETRRFGSLLETFGTPHYCKIDIEGNDNFCLEDMTREAKPRFVSVEAIRGDEQLRLLHQLGYSRFKIISQRTLRQPAKWLSRLKAPLPRPARWFLTTAEARLARRRSDGAWRFPRGSSGPFGEDTAGKWLTFEQALELEKALPADDLSDWFDIHAAI